MLQKEEGKVIEHDDLRSGEEMFELREGKGDRKEVYLNGKLIKTSLIDEGIYEALGRDINEVEEIIKENDLPSWLELVFYNKDTRLGDLRYSLVKKNSLFIECVFFLKEIVLVNEDGVENYIKRWDNYLQEYFEEINFVHENFDEIIGFFKFKVEVVDFNLMNAIKEVEEKSEICCEKVINSYNDNRYEEKIKVDVKLRTILKQYLIYFQEYVFNFKNENVGLEVESYDEGLIIKIDKENNIDEVLKYFKEYIGFIKEKNLNQIELAVNSNISDLKKELAIIDLKNQIRHLKSNLEIKAVEVKYLNQSVERLEKLLFLEKKKMNIININQNNICNIDSKEVIEKISNDLYLLRNEIVDLGDTAIKEKLHEIDEEFTELNNCKSETEKKSKVLKLRRLLDQLLDEESQFNSLVNKSKQGIRITKDIAKNYNKVASILGLPIVPEMLLG